MGRRRRRDRVGGPSFADVLDRGHGLIGVDIPIGLLETGSRPCDIATRTLLGKPRSASVFVAPMRVRAARDDVARRGCMLQGSYRKVLVAAGFRDREPFGSSGRGALRVRHRPAGSRTRRLKGAAPNDVLDALAALWSARRAAEGRAHRLGGELDPRGLRMEIVY